MIDVTFTPKVERNLNYETHITGPMPLSTTVSETKQQQQQQQRGGVDRLCQAGCIVSW